MFALFSYNVQRLLACIPEVLELTDKCHALNSLSTGSLIEDGAMRKAEERRRRSILVSIALFAYLSRRILGTRNERLWKHFPVLDVRTPGLHVCTVSIYCMRLSMAAVEANSSL